MAFLLIDSLALVIGAAIMIIATIIGLFLGHIIVFESVGLAIAAGCLANTFLHIHPAFCLLIGIGVLASLLLLMKTRIGFWLIGSIMSLLWGFLVAVIVYISTGEDMTWMYVSWGLATVVVLGLHLAVRGKGMSV